MLSNYPTGTKSSDFEPLRCSSCGKYHETDAEESYCVGLGDSVVVIYNLYPHTKRGIDEYFAKNPAYIMKDDLPEAIQWNEYDEVYASDLELIKRLRQPDLETISYRLELLSVQVRALTAIIENKITWK